jgi:hypothetical protein
MTLSSHARSQSGLCFWFHTITRWRKRSEKSIISFPYSPPHRKFPRLFPLQRGEFSRQNLFSNLIYRQIQELFEVVSCYFPITFKPKANDPAAITREDLITSIREALSSTPDFAPFALPFFLEKLSSDVTDTKIDALQTLATAAKTFGNFVEISLEDLWASLRTELTTAKSTDKVVVESYKTLLALTQSMSGLTLSRWLDLIGGQTKKMVKDAADPELDREFVKILTLAAGASPQSCEVNFLENSTKNRKNWREDIEIYSW